MAQANEAKPTFVLGLDAGPIGRVSRLILGGMIPIYSIIRILLANDLTLGFYAQAALYFAVIFLVYLAAHYFLGERLLARVNPWVGTLILVVPPSIALLFRLGPPPFQIALGLYVAISLIFNFIMSYGGCEVMALPSLIFRRRYVVYCPWNVVDLADKVIADGRAESSATAAD